MFFSRKKSDIWFQESLWLAPTVIIDGNSIFEIILPNLTSIAWWKIFSNVNPSLREDSSAKERSVGKMYDDVKSK